MHIFILGGQPVAVLRLDKVDNSILVSYSVATEHRGKGIGREIVIMLPEIIRNENIECEKVIAEVFKTNVASNRIFTSANYQKQENDTLHIYSKWINPVEQHLLTSNFEKMPGGNGERRVNPFSPIYQKLNSGAARTTSLDMPIIIDIEITNVCNFECLFCYTGTKANKRPSGFMSRELFEKIINEIAPFKIPLRFIRWGEPMLHKDFFEYLQMAKTKNIMCHINTNGSLIDRGAILKLLEIKLDSLKFSFQGTDEKTYGEMRYGQSFGKLINIVKMFHELRGSLAYPYLHASTTVTYETPEMIQSFKDLLAPYCDLVTVGHTSLSHISSEQTKLPEEAKVLLDNLKCAESIEREYKICNEVYDKLSINWDGTVSACCGDYDNYMIVGDLAKESIQDIWKNSDKLKLFRSMLSEFKHTELPLCKNCYDVMNLRTPFMQGFSHFITLAPCCAINFLRIPNASTCEYILPSSTCLM
jgi:MoaA/NifB/PqqE/SkfB family radical SAM enzyme